MLRKAVLVLALAVCVMAAELPIRRVPHSGPHRWFGLKHGRIVGGSDATLGQFPYQVSLQWAWPGASVHTCGGSLVSARAVVTAGQCVDPYSNGYYEAVAGINSLAQDRAIEQRVRVSEEVLHPDYQLVGFVPINDIAVFLLESSMSLGGNVQAISLPSAGAVPSAGSTATMSGWGSVGTDLYPDFPDILQWADVTIRSISECMQLVRISALSDDNVCTGSGNDGIISLCSQDGGGPLAQNGQLIGIASWGTLPCGTPGAPSVFTRVAAFTDFVNQYI